MKQASVSSADECGGKRCPYVRAAGEDLHSCRMKLLSGGQSGVDRAVLDVALARGIPYGGWCPKGGWAEDFPEPPGVLAKYPQLAETPLGDPAQRTEWNVRDADACLILVDVDGLAVSRGTALARDQAAHYGKPLFISDLGAAEVGDRAAAWLGAQRATFGPDLALTIGGPRESEAPAIYARATAFIGALLDRRTPSGSTRNNRRARARWRRGR
jgi:Circularly permutated YpsA SLOG family